MTYLLTISHLDDRSTDIGIVLTAELQRLDDGRVIPIRASIDQEPGGRLSVHGMNAYRVLCCAEMIIAEATGE